MQDELMSGLFQLRHYPEYELCGTASAVFRDHQHLLEYETALRAELECIRLLESKQFAETEELMHSTLNPGWQRYCCELPTTPMGFLAIYEPG
jgi:hypothetical protein